LSPFGSYSFVQAIRGSFVQQIEPAKDVIRVEEDKLFCTIFKHGKPSER
jgi:hypothetical protein